MLSMTASQNGIGEGQCLAYEGWGTQWRIYGGGLATSGS